MRAALVALAIAVIGLPASASADRNRIKVAGTAPFGTMNGYTGVVLQIRSEQEDELTITGTCRDAAATLTLDTLPNETVTATLLLPPALEPCRWIELEWASAGGASGDTTVSVDFYTSSVYVLDPGERLDLDEISRIVGREYATPYGFGDLFPRRQAAELPDRWQGMPAESMMALTLEGYDALTERQRTAVVRWSQSGGRLLPADLKLEGRLRADGARVGAIRATWATSAEKRVAARVGEQYEPSGRAPAVQDVPGTNALPVIGFVTLVLLFVLVVGPLNLWYVIRRRRTLFLVTTPALSIAACLLLVGYNVATRNPNLRRAAVQLTWLDSSSHHAFAWSSISFFGSEASEPFELSALASVRLPNEIEDILQYSEVYEEGSGDFERAGTLALEWQGDAQIANGPWVLPRTNRQLVFAEPRVERRRLLLRSLTSGGYELTNGLGVDIEWLVWRDQRRQTWGCGELAAGATVQLDPGTDLPEFIQGVEYLGAHGRRVWSQALYERHYFVAGLSEPLSPLPGPDAADATDPIGFAAGPLQPGGAR